MRLATNERRVLAIARLRTALICSAWLVAGAATAAAATAAARATSKAAVHAVAIEGTKYSPESIVVKRGDKVVWTNNDPFPHTVTAKGTFDSGSIAPDKAWTYIARRKGQYEYICTLHPNMKGTLTVQ